MTKTKDRSTSVKRKQKSGGRTLYKRKETAKQKCAVCKNPFKLSLKKGKKTVSRKFGGTLCVSCSRTVMKHAARIKKKKMTPDDVDVEYLKYVQQVLK